MENSNPFALSIFDKLAQLKQWQSEQHERLIREQEQQRELLAQERELQFEEAYDKGNKELKDEDLPCSGPPLDLNQHQEVEDQALGVSYLSSTSESDADSSYYEPSNVQPSSTSIFSENKHSEMVAMNLENLQSKTSEPTDTVKPKFSFLKRGQGLSRFRLTTDDIQKQNQRIKASKAKPGAKKSQRNTGSSNVGQKNARKKTVNKLPEKPATTTRNNVQQIRNKNKPPVVQQAKNLARNPVRQADGKLLVPRSPSLPALDLANIPPGPSRQEVTTGTNPVPELNKVPEQPVSLLQELQAATGTAQNTVPSWATMLAQPKPSTVPPPSSADSSRIVEQHELRLFERLERIADDSSFCSSSSIVTKFVEGGYISSSVQSTPQTTPSKSQNHSMPVTSSPLANPNPKPTLQNARSLLEKLAAYHFAPKPASVAPAAPAKKDDIKLELHPLPGTKGEEENWSESEDETPTQHRVRFKETPQVREVWTEQEAWSEESGSDSSTECEEETVPKELFVDQPVQQPQPVVQQVAQQQQHSKSSDEEEESEYSSTVDDEDEQRRVVGAMVHARLEQLSQEVLVVKKQQALLASQQAEVEAQKQRLAQAIADAEEERRKLQAERASIGGITKKRNNQERDQLQQLTKQLEEMQLNWKEREARWAAAQASQRTQLRQLGQENKQLAFQIKQLKVEQGKKVRFAPTKTAQPRIPQFSKKEETVEVRRVTLPAAKKVSEAPTSHVRTRSASPSIRVPSPEDSKVGDLDTLLSKYKNMYDSGQSPSSSLMLDTPRKISKAYNEMFSDKAEEQSSSALLSDEETLYKEPVFSQDKTIESVNSSRRTSLSFSASDKTEDSVIEVAKVETVKNEVPHVKFADQSSNYCPPKLSTHSDSEPYHSLIHEDGTRQLWFPSGNTLKISPDGLTRRVVFHNGDIQETLAREGIVRYFYAETRAWHETFSDGTQTITFPDGQKEMVTPSGRREVKFADQSMLQLLEDGSQTVESDTGAKLIQDPDGTSTLILPNGIKEIRTSEYTRLEYPDGTVRTKYPSGMLETKYANGRVRMKDSTGKLIMDTHSPV